MVIANVPVVAVLEGIFTLLNVNLQNEPPSNLSVVPTLNALVSLNGAPEPV
jgi:hypothetical protein